MKGTSMWLQGVFVLQQRCLPCCFKQNLCNRAIVYAIMYVHKYTIRIYIYMYNANHDLYVGTPLGCKAPGWPTGQLFAAAGAKASTRNEGPLETTTSSETASYRCLWKNTPFARASAWQLFSRNCSPAPALVLRKPIFLGVFFSGGEFFNRHRYVEKIDLINGVGSTGGGIQKGIIILWAAKREPREASKGTCAPLRLRCTGPSACKEDDRETFQGGSHTP